MTVKFKIKYPEGKKAKSEFCRRFGLNAYYAGKHWAARKKDANVMHDTVRAAVKMCGVRQRVFNRPVEVFFYWDDGLDIDNHAALGKGFVDGLKGVLLVDDSPRWIRAVHHEFWKEGCIGVEIREVET